MAQTEAVTQFEIQNAPTDGITRVQFSKDGRRLVASSWDKSVALYDIDSDNYTSKQIQSYEHRAAVLDCCLSPDSTQIVSGGCDNLVMKCDIESGKCDIIGSHTRPVRCIQSYNDATFVSGSWDKSVKVWDIRGNSNPVTAMVPSKVFTMAMCHNLLVVGCSGREVYIYDIRNMSEPQQKRESSLKHQTRYVAGHPNGQQYVLSSTEGRVAVEFFNTDPKIQSKKYAFKCHRLTNKETQLQTIYPVNAITFHPTYHTFATGGCDGVVNIWDGENKKRICQFPAYAASIACLDFAVYNNDHLLAIAQSYTWEQGAQSHAKDAIFIRKVKDSEVKPKVKRKA